MAECIVKQVLRGTTSTAGSSVAVTLSPAVDPARSIILFSVKNDQSSVWDYATRANFDSGSQITFYRSGNTGTLYISWEVVEFTNASGVLVQHGSSALSAASTQINLGTSVDTGKSWIMISFQRSNMALNQNCFLKAKFNSGSQIQIDSYASPVTCTVNYQVIQYDGCSVQTLELSNKNAANTTETISSVNTAKTATFTSCSAYVSQTYDETMIYRVSVDSATAIRFQKYGGAGNGFNITCFVVTFSDDTVVDQYTVTFTGTDASISTTVTSRDRAVTVHHQSAQNNPMLSGSDSATNDGDFSMMYSEMTSNTNITTSRTGTGAAQVTIQQVLAFLTVSGTWTGEPRAVGRGVMRGVGRGIG